MTRRIKTVQVEFLRHGPPHNHLLSPLTRYLGICGDAGAVEVSAPFEHQELLRLSGKLSYPGGIALGVEPSSRELERRSALQALSASVSRVLKSVPSLSEQLGMGDSVDELIHLEIVVSAAELAALPFELSADIAPGEPNSGDFLAVSRAPRVSITRRVRGARSNPGGWARKPRILFAYASPEGTSVPSGRHVDALQEAIQPWLRAEGDPVDRVDEWLTVLPDADVEKLQRSIADAASTSPYTHVHVLAHGVPDPGERGANIGLAFHDSNHAYKKHVVGWRQFASALDAGAATPTVVTLATCDLGRIGDVVYSGASFAHGLHQLGIPCVIASQFPLTKDGSCQVVSELYPGLLRGRDPRHLLRELRQRLHATSAHSHHDWASLVAYLALPTDFERQLEELEYLQSKLALKCSLELAERRLGATAAGGAAEAERAERLVLRRSTEMLCSGRFETEGLGLRAAAQKQLAEAYFRAALSEARGSGGVAPDQNNGSTVTSEGPLSRCIAALSRAKVLYSKALRRGLTHDPNKAPQYVPLHWVAAQELCLSAVLGEGWLASNFGLAKLGAECDTVSSRATNRVWGHGALAELFLLDVWVDSPTKAASADLAVAHTERLVSECANLANPQFPIKSTLRQFKRYQDWWWDERFVEGVLAANHRAEQPLRRAEVMALIGLMIAALERALNASMPDVARQSAKH